MYCKELPHLQIQREGGRPIRPTQSVSVSAVTNTKARWRLCYRKHIPIYNEFKI